MKRLAPLRDIVTVALLIVILGMVCSQRQAEAADGVYACWYFDGDLLMAGYYHPAALEGGPHIGPATQGQGLGVIIGESCGETAKVPAEPSPTPAPTATPTPEITPTPPPEGCRWRAWIPTFDERGYYNVASDEDWHDC